MRFGEKALQLKFVTVDQVEESLHVQEKYAAEGISKSLGAIMHDLGYLDLTQVQAIMAAIGDPAAEIDTIPGFRIERVLGRGTTGTVYQAVQEGIERTVAVKVLAPMLSEDAIYLQRFQREMQVVAKVDHPNIVRAYDAGTSIGYHYFVMEFIEGFPLKELIGQQGALDESTALAYLIDVAMAMDHIAELGLVHRDIKPGNIMITLAERAKVLDLGLTKELDDSDPITRKGVVLGTPFYISPEQAMGRSVDTRSDIYSLGATLYHAVTGRPPFQGSNPKEILAKVCEGNYPDPGDVNPALGEGMCTIIQKALAVNPDDRYDLPRAMANDMKEVLQTGTLGELGLSSRVKRWFQRWRSPQGSGEGDSPDEEQ